MNPCTRYAALAVLLAVMVSVPATGHPDTYPSRDITFIVPYAPGGTTDPLARQYAIQLKKMLPVNINIENKAGGTGTIGTGIVVRAKPDGYTIGVTGNSTVAYQPLVTSGLPFNTPDDYLKYLTPAKQP
jgi:tripartite-type tricarboxylate transporter receptor subunit TctC